MIKNEEEKDWYRRCWWEAILEVKRGWYVDWELIICVGRKGV